MATYNRAHLIEDCLQSIQNQTYQNWECIIIDDGSTDNTEDIVKKWKNKDERFLYFKRTPQHQKGLPGCRNQGLNIAKGQYIIFFDDDDIVHPQNLELCKNYLKESKFHFVNYMKKPFLEKSNINMKKYEKYYVTQNIEQKHIFSTISYKIKMASCTIMWKKEVFKNDNFIEKLQYAEEWELYNRLLIKGFTGQKINNILYFNRKHINSNTGKYYNNDLEKINSKIKASIFLIELLGQYKKLNREFINFFLSIRSKKESQEIYNKIKYSNSINYNLKLYTYIRFNFSYLFKILYSLKKRIKAFI